MRDMRRAPFPRGVWGFLMDWFERCDEQRQGQRYAEKSYEPLSNAWPISR